MFTGCKNFNQPLNSWDVSSVAVMSYMFRGCKNFNQPLDSWDVSSVTKMSGIFDDCKINDENKPNEFTKSKFNDNEDDEIPF